MLPREPFTPVNAFSAIEQFCGFKLYHTLDKESNTVKIKIINYMGDVYDLNDAIILKVTEDLLEFVESFQKRELKELEENKNR